MWPLRTESSSATRRLRAASVRTCCAAAAPRSMPRLRPRSRSRLRCRLRGMSGAAGLRSWSVNGQTAALDFRETAPAAATRNMYLDAQGAVTDRSVTGHLAAGVPGSVAGLWTLHQKFGTKPWGDLVNPAMTLAERGFAVDADFSSAIGDEAKRLSKYPPSAALFLPGGAKPAEGSRWSDPDLAQVLKRIAA